MRVPKNITSEDLYTSGGEFVEVKTNAPYKGYYCELNGKFYIGKVFDTKSPELIKIKEANSLFSNLSTALFSAISGIASQAIASANIKGNPVSNGLSHSSDLTFYSKQLNVNPILIKSIDENTFLALQKDAMYQTTYIGDYKGNIITADQAYSQMTGLKEFLEG